MTVQADRELATGRPSRAGGSPTETVVPLAPGGSGDVITVVTLMTHLSFIAVLVAAPYVDWTLFGAFEEEL